MATAHEPRFNLEKQVEALSKAIVDDVALVKVEKEPAEPLPEREEQKTDS